MANIKSAKKRILVNETKAAKNKAIKSRVKTSVKKVEAAVAQKDMEALLTAAGSCKNSSQSSNRRDQQSRKQRCLPQKNCFQKDFPSYKSCKRNCLIFDINMNHKKTSATVMANVFFVYAPAF